MAFVAGFIEMGSRTSEHYTLRIGIRDLPPISHNNRSNSLGDHSETCRVVSAGIAHWIIDIVNRMAEQFSPKIGKSQFFTENALILLEIFGRPN